MSDEAIETFKKAARPYGLRYLHLHDSNGDGLSTLMVRGEDAAVINRLIERNKLAVLTDVTQAEIERDPSKAADVNELPEVVIGKDQVRVQDAVKEARGSAQDLLKPEPNPTVHNEKAKALEHIEKHIKKKSEWPTKEDYESAKRLAGEGGHFVMVENNALKYYMEFVENFKRILNEENRD